MTTWQICSPLFPQLSSSLKAPRAPSRLSVVSWLVLLQVPNVTAVVDVAVNVRIMASPANSSWEAVLSHPMSAHVTVRLGQSSWTLPACPPVVHAAMALQVPGGTSSGHSAAESGAEALASSVFRVKRMRHSLSSRCKCQSPL